MPRYNNDGRSNKFVHMLGSSEGRKKFDQDDRNKFKFTLNKGGIQRKNRGGGAFARLDATGDTVMDPSEPSSSRSGHVHFEGAPRGKKFGGNNKQWRKQNQQGKNNAHIFGPLWHKILILNGKAYAKEFVLPALGQRCRIPFVPICYSVYGANTAFYVEGRSMAEALAECSGQIMSSDGQTIIAMRVTPSGAPPTAHIDEACEARIKTVLDLRYNSAMHTLNLENFYMSPEFVNDYFLPLYRPSVVQKLTELLQPHLDSIVGLDLSNNKLPALDGLSKIINKSTALKALNLRGNKIREMQSLDRISAPSIIELILEGNPVCDNTEDKEAFIRSRG
ncbi:Nuclear RNA export factor 1 [Folsomia candida]|uniref:Nuclear RNA export factor 1 n=1 Tax=Folsomia candida TaxID=158441 RepID=A0A226DPF6_FOLCA|nr:Nuclear RNA export factor 1 [Folsomia candida]